MVQLETYSMSSTGLSLFDRLPFEIRIEIYRHHFAGRFGPQPDPQILVVSNRFGSFPPPGTPYTKGLEHVSKAMQDELEAAVYPHFTFALLQYKSLYVSFRILASFKDVMDLKQVRSLMVPLKFDHVVHPTTTDRADDMAALRRILPNLQKLHLQILIPWDRGNLPEDIIESSCFLPKLVGLTRPLQGIESLRFSLSSEPLISAIETFELNASLTQSGFLFNMDVDRR